MIKRTFLGLLLTALACILPAAAAPAANSDLQTLATNSISRLNRDASTDPEMARLVADLLGAELGTREVDLQWGVDRKLGWGQIAALAYIQATTGKSFDAIRQEDALRDFSSYAENVGMSFDKMARWLAGFQKRAERERNSRIFDSLRASRRVFPLPDIGSGFGLLQEGLDFRNIDSSRPTKVHDLPGELAKGEK